MNDMNRERDKAFNDWEAQATRETGEEIAWQVGYTAALEARPDIVTKHIQFGLDAARSDARQAIMDKAVQAFRDGRDETARSYRNLANELFGEQT